MNYTVKSVFALVLRTFPKSNDLIIYVLKKGAIWILSSIIDYWVFESSMSGSAVISITITFNPPEMRKQQNPEFFVNFIF